MIFDRRRTDWVYHSKYIDKQKTRTKRVLTWKGIDYDVLQDHETHQQYFIKDNIRWDIKL